MTSVAPSEASVHESRLGYRPELDGVRGIAILFVLFVHLTNWFPGGGIGVDVFFTLSGFLITTLLLEEWRTYGEISLQNFYARRFLRLLPAMLILVAAFVVLGSLVNYGSRSLKIEAAAYSITYTSNWALAFEHPMQVTPVAHLWSLAIEEQFYLLWPSILTLLLRRGATAKTLKRVLVGAIAAIAVWRFVLLGLGTSAVRLYHGTDTRIDELLVGCLLAVFLWTRPRLAAPSPITIGAAFGTIGALLLFGFLGNVDAGDTFWLYGLFLPGLAWGVAALIRIIMSGTVQGLNRALRVRWLVYVGLLSYSLYLWHPLALATLRYLRGNNLGAGMRVMAFALSFGVAAASYHLAEMPFLRLKRRFQRLSSTKSQAEPTLARLAPEGLPS